MDSPMLTPYEGEFRTVDGRLQVHPVDARGRKSIGGYIERDENGHWRFVQR